MHHLIETNLEPTDVETAFQEFVSECYPESVKVLWMDLDPVTVVKLVDPISWDLAKSEHIDSLMEDGLVVTFDNGCTHFNTHDIETFLDESEKGCP